MIAEMQVLPPSQRSVACWQRRDAHTANHFGRLPDAGVYGRFAVPLPPIASPTIRCGQRWSLQVLSFPEPPGLPHILLVIAGYRTPSRIAVATMDKPFGHGDGEVGFVGQSVILSDQEARWPISPRCQVRDGTAIGQRCSPRYG